MLQERKIENSAIFYFIFFFKIFAPLPFTKKFSFLAVAVFEIFLRIEKKMRLHQKSNVNFNNQFLKITVIIVSLENYDANKAMQNRTMSIDVIFLR